MWYENMVERLETFLQELGIPAEEREKITIENWKSELENKWAVFTKVRPQYLGSPYNVIQQKGNICMIFPDNCICKDYILVQFVKDDETGEDKIGAIGGESYIWKRYTLEEHASLEPPVLTVNRICQEKLGIVPPYQVAWLTHNTYTEERELSRNFVTSMYYYTEVSEEWIKKALETSQKRGNKVTLIPLQDIPNYAIMPADKRAFQMIYDSYFGSSDVAW